MSFKTDDDILVVAFCDCKKNFFYRLCLLLLIDRQLPNLDASATFIMSLAAIGSYSLFPSCLTSIRDKASINTIFVIPIIFAHRGGIIVFYDSF